MGATSMTKPDNVAEWLRQSLTWEANGRRNRCLDVAIVNRTNAYAAVETTHEDGTIEVWAAVYALKFHPNSADGFTFTYKDMTERMGPIQRDCPKRILDLLTPTDDRNANEWREKCRARMAIRPEVGDYIKFTYPYHFRGYGEFDTFRVAQTGRRYRFDAIDPATGDRAFLACITSWKDSEFRKLEPHEIPGCNVPRP